MPFQQPPPSLGNQYEDDRVLRSYLARVLPESMRNEIEPSLVELGRLAGGELYQMQLADRLNEPSLTQWDAWGNRIDQVEVTPLWREAERIAIHYGLVATAYEQKHGSLSRVHQCALAYLFTPSTDIYSCPLAMTDGAARTLLNSGNQALIDHVVPHLTSRNPADFWTAGQWMTELTGGSDVGLSETIAKPATQAGEPQGQEGGLAPAAGTQMGMPQGQEGGLAPTLNPESHFSWRLYGTKWFTSAINSQIALTLARPEGNPPGGRGLALFYLELRNADGQLRNIQINRLKDKLGTRKVPTAELTLNGTPAQLVKGPSDGVRNITPLLNITRLWNGISAISLMRRGLALALDYARKRIAFGETLSKKPLHMDTLAGLQAEFEAAFHLAFFVAELTGRAETVTTDATKASDSATVNSLEETDSAMKATDSATINSLECAGLAALWPAAAPNSLRNGTTSIHEDEALLLRLLTPVMKLTTGKQTVLVLSEIIEAFGGAGYVEDTGLPQLLRDSQVLPIWEGTTNVLSLDTLRALAPAAVTQVGMSQGQEAGLAPAHDASDPASNIQSTLDTEPASAGTAGVPPATSAQREQILTGGTEPANAGTAGVSPATSAQREQIRAPNDRVASTSPAFQTFKAEVTCCLQAARDPRLNDPVRITQAALAHAETWLAQKRKEGQPSLEAGARRFAMTLGRMMELALLIKHAQWSQDHEADGRATAAARRFANSGIDLLVDHSLDDTQALFPDI